MSALVQCNGQTKRHTRCLKRTKLPYCRLHIPLEQPVPVPTPVPTPTPISAQIPVPTPTPISAPTPEQEECCVCYDPITTQLKPCGHHIHPECVYKTGRNLCPVCCQPVNLTQSQLKRMNQYKQKYKREDEAEERNEIRQMLQREQANQANQATQARPPRRFEHRILHRTNHRGHNQAAHNVPPNANFEFEVEHNNLLPHLFFSQELLAHLFEHGNAFIMEY
jgi:hypothetical protein